MSSNLTDDEKRERIEKAKETAKNTREKYDDGKYFSLGEAVDEIKQANGVGQTTVASTKLVGKSLFNIGKFALAEALPSFLDRAAEQNEKALNKK